MLTGIYQIGQFLKNDPQQGQNNIFENPRERGSYNHVLKIAFEEGKSGISYSGVEYEEFSEQRLHKYAYKKADGANGGDHTPTSILNLKEPQKTLKNIMKSQKRIFESLKDKSDLEQIQLHSAWDIVNEKSEDIVNDIKSKLKSIKFDKKEGAILTVIFYDNAEEKYIGDFKLVNDYIERINDERFYKKYNKESRGESKCYFCHKYGEVFGFVNTFNFYTVDKKNLVTGGFNQDKSWINYPVCPDCAHVLEAGKKYIFNNLRSNFSGFNYMVIPKVVFPEKDIMEDMHYILKDLEKGTKFSTTGSNKENLLGSEDQFLDLIKDNNNNMSYNMLIYKEENAAFRILLYIEDIVPSRVKNILRVKDAIELEFSDTLFDKLSNKGFSFKKLRYFFPNDKKEGNYDKAFLEILNNVFTNRKISYSLILGQIMGKTRILFSREEYYEFSVLEGLMCILFLQRLDLFNDKKEGEDNSMVNLTDKNKLYLDFMEDKKEIFNSSDKKAAFLIGVLSNNLMNIQYRDKNSKPFYSRLNGLKLDEKLIRRVYVEAINKLNEYGKNYYTALEELIGEYLLYPINMTDDEISFYFTLGMSLNGKFKVENNEIVEGDKNDKE
ncbi:MAG: TIGR02556 family CRISPR-associated protein [Lutispora sp.]|nr:TIGR02556 family CRISPR-associated protein [Lutispora sp.]